MPEDNVVAAVLALAVVLCVMLDPFSMVRLATAFILKLLGF